MDAKLLDQLAELYAKRDLVSIEQSQARDDAIPDEIKGLLADIEVEYAPKLKAVNEKITALEEEIKTAVKAEGASIKGQFLHAVFTKGRVTWDSKMLEGLMVAMPDLVKARKFGESSVAIRKVQS